MLQRAAATITMVAVFAMGALLAGRGELTVGEIVSFAALAHGQGLFARMVAEGGFTVPKASECAAADADESAD